MTGPRQAQLLAATDLILDARRTATPIPDLPPDLQPATPEEAFYIQSQLLQSFGGIGGWKVGAPTHEVAVNCAPMPSTWIASNAPVLTSPTFRYRGVEPEVAFLLGADLPARSSPYTLPEVKQAVQSCHPAIEIIESAFTDPLAVGPLSRMADLQINGGFVYGPACSVWQSIDFAKESVSLAIDGSIRAEHTASSTPSDFFLNLLVLLANQGAARTGGLRAGQWITTGSWTGLNSASAGSAVDIQFSTLGRVALSFA